MSLVGMAYLCQIRLNLHIHFIEDRLFSHLSRVVLLASIAVNSNDALLLEKVPTVAKELRLAVASESVGRGRLHKY